MTPFEFFRTPLNLYRNVNGFFVEGRWQQGSQASLDNDLVTGNVVQVILNSVALTPVNFTVDNATTMQLIADEIAAQVTVKRVNLSGTNDRVLTIIDAFDQGNELDGFSITGGASQANVTIENSPEIIVITSSVQPTTGQDMKMLPEGRDNIGEYKLYTSFEVRTVEDTNPDQVEFFGKRYELVRVYPWQNNSNFTIVNHYKYLTVELRPLGNS